MIMYKFKERSRLNSHLILKHVISHLYVYRIFFTSTDGKEKMITERVDEVDGRINRFAGSVRKHGGVEKASTPKYGGVLSGRKNGSIHQRKAGKLGFGRTFEDRGQWGCW